MADDAGLRNTVRTAQVLSETAFLYGGNAAFVEDLYARYGKDPNSVEPSWRAYFESLHEAAPTIEAGAAEPSWTRAATPVQRPDWLSAIDGLWPAVEAKVSKAIAEKTPAASPTDVRAATLDSVRAIMMIRAFRIRGHLQANLDPLGLQPRNESAELDPANYGFAERDYDRPIFLDYVLGLETANLREILAILRRTYCGNVGVQYMHISDPMEKAWIQERIEGKDKEITFTPDGKKAILKKLIEAEGFERFLHKRFPGTKRFGLDGAESMVPALEQIIKRGGALGVDEIVVGMPPRGRLNVLAAVMGKPYRVIFHEFQGGSSLPSDIEGSGRREVPPGRLVGPRVRRQQRPPVADRQPLAPGDRQSRGDREGAGQADAGLPRGRARRPRQGHAAAAARRRRLRRSGRDRGVLRPDGAEGLQHRRHGAFHRQQPESASPPARAIPALRPIPPTPP